MGRPKGSPNKLTKEINKGCRISLKMLWIL